MVIGKIKKISESQRKLRQEMKEKPVSYIVAAFGLVAGLAWNEAIKGMIDYFFPLNKNSVLAKFIYAVLVTFAVVLITFYLIKIIEKEEKK
ncbi:MAG: DUF5654 family protein [Candidatus Pacebacteria bacterium]|nr:DUF5654 family protein [Candidatus Paceibacterota bacterium]